MPYWKKRFWFGASLALLLGSILQILHGKSLGWEGAGLFGLSSIYFAPVTRVRSVAKPNGAVVDLLSRFPRPLVLQGTRSRPLFLSIGGVVFSLVSGSEALSGRFSGAVKLIFIFGAIFFALGAVSAFFAVLQPKRLTLDENGMTFESSFRRRHWLWRDVYDLRQSRESSRGGIESPFTSHRVSFFVRPSRDLLSGEAQPVARASFSVFQNEFGITSDKLFMLLFAWRSLAIGRQRYFGNIDKFSASDT